MLESKSPIFTTEQQGSGAPPQILRLSWPEKKDNILLTLKAKSNKELLPSRVIPQSSQSDVRIDMRWIVPKPALVPCGRALAVCRKIEEKNRTRCLKNILSKDFGYEKSEILEEEVTQQPH